MNEEMYAIASLIRMCEKKMGIGSRIPRKTKKLIKRYMVTFGERYIVLNKQEIFMREDGTIFMIKN